MKKITILVCTLFIVLSFGACGKTKEDGTVLKQQESSVQIESINETVTSEESAAFIGVVSFSVGEKFEFPFVF